MSLFAYIARDIDGTERRGTIEAESRIDAIAAVRANGLMPTAIGKIKEGPMIQPKGLPRKNIFANLFKGCIRGIIELLEPLAFSKDVRARRRAATI